MREPAQQLTRAIAAGDPAAFARFYDLWFDRVYRDARRVTGRDEAFCLDVVQDVMMRVIRSMKPLPDDARLTAWLRVVVRSCAIDRLRRETRLETRARRRGDVRSPDAAARADRLRWLEAELADLDAESRDLLLMRHRLGWTLERIAVAVGLSPGAVDGRLRRLTGRLRRRATKEVLDD